MISPVQFCIPDAEPEFRLLEQTIVELVGKEKAEDHLGLVWQVAKKYTTGAILDSYAYSDGCIGLLRAIKTFKEGRGCAFSTWARKLIERSIVEEYRRRARQIRIPAIRMSEISASQRETVLSCPSDNEDQFDMTILVDRLGEMLEPHPDDTQRDKRNKWILEQRYLEGKSQAEIGKQMDMTRAGVSAAEKKGLNLLRSRFGYLLKE